MAKIEDLVKNIPDAKLRDEIAREVARLKSEKKFGLVFEEHLPEQVLLPSLPIKPGARVVRRGAETEIFTVLAPAKKMRSSRVRIAREIDGQEETASANELIVIRKFGEPIYPTLVPVERVTRANGKPYHTIINAENFHALQLLLYCYEGQVDVIYIDPPYNSGARDWKYNNNYVDKTDQFRHSKWLSMLKRRLLLAKRLLKPDGILIVTVDENEVGHLGVLLEGLFPEYLRHMVTVVINPKGTGKLNFARVDEYIFFCVPNDGTSLIKGIPTSIGTTGAPGEGALFYPTSQPLLENLGAQDDIDDEAEEDFSQEDVDVDIDVAEDEELPFPHEEIEDWELRHARRRGSESSYRHQRKNQFYPIYIDVNQGRVVRSGPPLLPIEKRPSFRKVDGLLPVWPIDKEGNDRCWRFVTSQMQKLIDGKFVRLGQYNVTHKSWTLNIWERKPESKKLKTVWWKKSHDAGTHGTTLLHKVLGQRAAFPFPKSIYAVADALAAVVRTRPDALIVDFFAGSGTTLQSTCMLNKVYGGSRRCILVTNNEVEVKLAAKLEKDGIGFRSADYEKHGICELVTWPRCKNVITGIRNDGKKLDGRYLDGRPMKEGFEENAEYFKLDFLDPDEVAYGDKFEAILPILWLMAGANGKLESERGSRGAGRWFIPKNSPYAVLIQEDHFAEFKRELKERPDITHVFLVTDSDEAYREMIAELSGSPKTRMLYKSYLDTFRINTERNL